MTEKIELKVGTPQKSEAENGPIWATPENLLFFLRWKFSTFFLFLLIKCTKMKVRPYFPMQKAQKLLKTP